MLGLKNAVEVKCEYIHIVLTIDFRNYYIRYEGQQRNMIGRIGS